MGHSWAIQIGPGVTRAEEERGGGAVGHRPRQRCRPKEQERERKKEGKKKRKKRKREERKENREKEKKIEKGREKGFRKLGEILEKLGGRRKGIFAGFSGFGRQCDFRDGGDGEADRLVRPRRAQDSRCGGRQRCWGRQAVGDVPDAGGAGGIRGTCAEGGRGRW
jgi:hypothetical protein